MLWMSPPHLVIACIIIMLSIHPSSAFSWSTSSSEGSIGGDGLGGRAGTGASGDTFFSLPEFRRARAKETASALDASRFHFRILFVDDDNARARVAEGLLARTAEHNDAMFILFPSSATVTAGGDGSPPPVSLSLCRSLGLCPHRSEAPGTVFDPAQHLDEYDLVVCMDDRIRTHVRRTWYAHQPDVTSSEENERYYSPRTRLWSDFGSIDFCGVDDVGVLLDVLDPELRSLVEPYCTETESTFKFVTTSGNHHLETGPWTSPLAAASAVLASAGLTRFCLDVMNRQLESAFQSLLEANLCRREHLLLEWDFVDERLRRCSSHITGYFSPEQRRVRFESHRAALERRLSLMEDDATTTQ